ncbi:MAG: hypothetical protein ONB23_05585 [candidate division KSB1 bacterium]|nr:hypothetical protein [candidate division KSB1 bacterium]
MVWTRVGAQTCGRCHGLPGLVSPEGKVVSVDTATYARSAHGKLECTSCHRGEWVYPHTEKSAPLTCGQCHPSEQRDYELGAHGKAAAAGSLDVPTCTTCHGVHDVASMASLAAQRQPLQNLLLNKCVECHTNSSLMQKYGIPLDRFASYESSAHGRADRFGSVAVARCATCHGSHAILPSADPHSPVNPTNLAGTCGKCHEDAERFVGRRYHVVAEAMPSPVTYDRLLHSFFGILLAFGILATVFCAVAAFRGER